MEEQSARNRVKKTITSPTEHGKLPPQAVDCEEAVLGSLMLEKDALMQVMDILKPEIFYKESHQKIFKAINELFNSGQPTDIITVTQKLRKNGDLDLSGGAYYITDLTSRVASSANIEYHSRIIQQKYLQRELIRISSEIIRDAFEDTTDVFDLISTAERELMTVADSSSKKQVEKYSDILKEVISEIKYLQDNPTKFTGVPSGFTELDRKTGGWQQGDFVIKAGRPGMGKTTESLQEAYNIAQMNIPVVFFSLEMTAKQLVKKIVSSSSSISLSKINSGNIETYEWEKINSLTMPIDNLFIDDTPAISTTELRSKAIRLKQKYGIRIIFIDYLQLMKAGGMNGKENREREISIISQSLKNIAKELNIPVVALSQLSREVEKRGGSKRPLLSDLRESGSLEQDADIVIFYYRPEYYKIEQMDFKGTKIATSGVCLMDCAKGRNIGTWEVLLNFDGRYSRFSNYSETFYADNNFPIPENNNFNGDEPF